MRCTVMRALSFYACVRCIFYVFTYIPIQEMFTYAQLVLYKYMYYIMYIVQQLDIETDMESHIGWCFSSNNISSCRSYKLRKIDMSMIVFFFSYMGSSIYAPFERIFFKDVKSELVFCLLYFAETRQLNTYIHKYINE